MSARGDRVRNACSLMLDGQGIRLPVKLTESAHGEELQVHDARAGGFFHVLVVDGDQPADELIDTLDGFVDCVARCQRFFSENKRWPEGDVIWR